MAANENQTPRLRCPHCGNRTPHVYLHDETVTWGESGDEGPPVFEHRRWALVKCKTCHEVSLYEARIGDKSPGPSPLKKHYRVHDLQLKWPNIGLPESVPDDVRAAYMEAMSVKQHSANAFANQIRRALEAVCNDRDAEGDNLHNMLGNLESRGEIPSQLGEMTELIRMVGNAGSHAGGFDVDERFVEPIDDFFQAAVRFIYELPNQIKQVQQEYEQASQPADEEDEEEITYEDLFGEPGSETDDENEGDSDLQTDDLFGTSESE